MAADPIIRTRLDIPSSPKNLQSVREIMETTASEAGFPINDVRKIVTAAFEAVVNAITHGSPLGDKNTIRISVSVFDDRMVVEVADQGKGFPKSTIRKMPDTTSPRGRGIPLMCSLVDDVRLKNNSGGKVILTKYRG